MGKRSTISLMMATLIAIGAFVYLSPSAPTPEMRAAARSAEVAARNAALSLGHPEADARRRSRNSARRAPTRGPADATGSTDRPGPRTRRSVIRRDRTVVRTVNQAAPATTPTTDDPANRRPRPRRSTRGPSPTTLAAPTSSGSRTRKAPTSRTWPTRTGSTAPSVPPTTTGSRARCSPSIPRGPASTPAGAKPPPPPPEPQPEPLPTTPTMEALLAPELNYFGVSTPQAPFDWKEFELFVHAAQKRPSLLLFFSGWDREFPDRQDRRRPGGAACSRSSPGSPARPSR